MTCSSKTPLSWCHFSERKWGIEWHFNLVLFIAYLFSWQDFKKLVTLPAAVLMMDICLHLYHAVNPCSLIAQHKPSVLPHASLLFALYFMPAFLASVSTNLSVSLAFCYLCWLLCWNQTPWNMWKEKQTSPQRWDGCMLGDNWLDLSQ